MQSAISEKAIRRKYISITSIKIIVLILLGSFAVHWINTPLSRFLFYGLAALYILRSRDYVADIALVFIFITHPLYLFYSEPYSWFIMITQTVGVNFNLAFVMALLLKFLILYPEKMSLQRDLFRTSYRIFFVYLVFLLFWSFVYGHSTRSLFFIVSFIPAFFLFLVLPKIFSRDQLDLFNGVVFFVNLVHILVSLIDVSLAGRITDFLVLGELNSTAIFEDDEIIRLTGGITMALYSLITGLYYIVTRTERFKPSYLWIIILASVLFIMNSATRGWMIASGVLLSLFLLYYYKQINSRKILISVIFTLSVGFLLLPENIESNLTSSFRRLSTVEYVLEGDMTAGGTASRWDLRGPRVLTRFNESPVFGFGLSSVSADYYDGHVGNHNLLLMGGIAGLVLVWGTALWIMLFLYRLERKYKYSKGVFVFGLAMVAIMVIHSTSRTMISFYMPVDTVFLIGLMFNHVNCRAAEQEPAYHQLSAPPDI